MLVEGNDWKIINEKMTENNECILMDENNDSKNCLIDMVDK